jgi:hypothetical protein
MIGILALARLKVTLITPNAWDPIMNSAIVRDSGGGFKVGYSLVDIKHELTDSVFRLPSTFLIQYGEAR